MQHARLYMQLADGSGEPGPDQRSKPRKAFALLSALLVVLVVATVALGVLPAGPLGFAAAAAAVR